MNLQKILSQIKIDYEIKQEVARLGEVDVLDVAIDSRKISSQKNTIFFALDGKTKSGEEFIASAIEKGARVVVAKVFCDDASVISIKTENPFLFLVEVLKIFYAPLPTNIYAITGTNGKTSTAEFIRQILGFVGKKSASIGTLGVMCDVPLNSELERFDLTTPDIVSLYKNLFILRANGVDDVALEVSSIGLEQARVAGLKIDVAGFTNFTQDHLDYHKTMEDYFLSKMLLFEAVLQDRSAVVLNADIAEFERIKKMCQAKKHYIFDYGVKAQGLRICEIKADDLGQEIEFELAGEKYRARLEIAGDFQCYNMLCALGMVMAKNYFAPEKMRQLLQKFVALHPAAGRMQRVARLPNKAQVFVDFAHSPDALENVLKLGRSMLHEPSSRLLVLFGCGGDRDNKKRPIMGEIASSLADVVIVTDDNPRSEVAAKIRGEILAACDAKKTIEIDGRENAIKKALAMLQPNDILILAGKGHEKYQIVGDKKSEFDEEKIVQKFLA